MDVGAVKAIQSRPPPSAALHRVLHWGTGVVLGLGAVLPPLREDWPGHWSVIQPFILSVALVYLCLGFLSVRRRFVRYTGRLGVALVTVALTLAAAEIAGRWAGVDYRGAQAALRRLPPYYVKPAFRVGDVYFRRQGPLEWRGAPIPTQLRHYGLDPGEYAQDPVITLRYDAEGFRNPPDLRDWTIAVAGDSFVELGYLPDEALFTTLLGQELGVRVRNLGTSHTGPLTQLYYLEHYGLAPSTRHLALVFYEGNDIEDLGREAAALARFRATGRQPDRDIHPQSSLLSALLELVFEGPGKDVILSSANAYFLSGEGEQAISLEAGAPASTQLSSARRQSLRDCFAEFAAFAQKHAVKPWLVYLPAKARVLEGRLRFDPDASPFVRDWRPTDLPEYIGTLAREAGLAFVDLTPALTEATRRTGRLQYNGLHDSHLNAAGSRVVAQALAEALRAPAVDHSPGR